MSVEKKLKKAKKKLEERVGILLNEVDSPISFMQALFILEFGDELEGIFKKEDNKEVVSNKTNLSDEPIVSIFQDRDNNLQISHSDDFMTERIVLEDGFLFKVRAIDTDNNLSDISKAEVEVLPNGDWKFSKEKWLEIMRQSGNVQYKPKHKMKNLKFYPKTRGHAEAIISKLNQLNYNTPKSFYENISCIKSYENGDVKIWSRNQTITDCDTPESTLDDLYEMDKPKKKYEFTTSQKEKVGICQHWEAIFIEDKNGRDLIQISFEDIFSIVKLIEDFKNGN